MEPVDLFLWSLAAIFAAAAVMSCVIVAAMVIAFLDDWRNGSL